MKNQVLKQAIYEVTSSGLPAAFCFYIEFLNQKNTKYRYIPGIASLQQVEYNQNASEEYCDDILLHLLISGNEYALMYENIQDLYCHVIISYMNVEGVKQSHFTPIKKKYRAMLVNPTDIRKHTTDVQYYVEPTIPIQVRLIEESVYKARAIQVNGIYTRTTVTEAIHHLALSFGFKKVTMEKAKNVHIYDHLVIPPMKDLGDCFPYIQREYGVYDKGLAQYVIGDSLYVYAPFNLTPKTMTHLNIYQTPLNHTVAVTSTIKLKKGLVEVVGNQATNVIDHSLFGAENHGTSLTFLRSSEVQDGVIQYHPKRPITFKKDVTLSIGLTEPRTLTTNTHRPRYATTTDNVFSLGSLVSEHQYTRLEMTWYHSMPFALRPGLLTNYYWDDNGKLKKKTGILESLYSVFIPTQMGAQNTKHSAWVLRGQTGVIVRLLPGDVTVKTIGR